MKRILLFFASIIMLGCSIDDDDYYYCGPLTTISESVYDEITIDYSILGVTVSQDCIFLEVSTSGCDGQTWQVNLVDSGQVYIENDEYKRNLKVQLINQEACAAVPTAVFGFNLSPLIVDDTNTIELVIEGYDEQVFYTY